ncbi:MAG: hypothetical protein Q9227_008539 [Pyrenula ochraceoflavens]
MAPNDDGPGEQPNLHAGIKSVPASGRSSVHSDDAWHRHNLLSLGLAWLLSIEERWLTSFNRSDGGGIRGYWSLLVLEKLMEHIAKIEQNEFHIGDSIPFKGHVHSFAPQPYPENVSQGITNDERRAQGQIMDLDAKLQALHATRTDSSEPYLIRSYDFFERHSSQQTRNAQAGPSRANPGISRANTSFSPPTSAVKPTHEAEDLHVWQAARAATAAPFYFDRFPHPADENREKRRWFEDAGFVQINNPTTEGIREIRDVYGQTSLGVVVSVGTSRKDSETGQGIRQKGRWMAGIASNPERVHKDAEKMSKQGGDTGFEYFRLNDQHRLDVEMDEWEPRRKKRDKNPGSTTLTKIRNGFNEWAAELDTFIRLHHCATLLVEHRRRRTRDPGKWERFATLSQYTCQDCDDVFNSQVQFERHLDLDHGRGESPPPDDYMRACRTLWRYQGEPQSN